MKNFICTLCVFGLAALLGPMSAEAQWTGGNYTAVVITSSGNYVYTPTGAAPGYVKALPHAMAMTHIQVRYSRTYTAPGGSGNLSLTPETTVTGASSGPSVASYGEPDNGHYGRSASSPNSYNATFTFSTLPPISPTSGTVNFVLDAYCYPNSSSTSGYADATGYWY